MSFIFIDPARRKLRKKSQKDEKSKQVLDLLNEYLDENLDEPVKWLLEFWAAQAAAVTLQELTDLLADASELSLEVLSGLWFQDYSKLVNDRIVPMWKEAMTAGAMSGSRLTRETTPGTETRTGTGPAGATGFSTSATHVMEWIRTRGADLVTNVTQEQKGAVRRVIEESVSAHMSSAETAKYIRPTIGLTERQAEANLRHYNAVKEQLRKEHPRMTDASIEKKARASAERYAKEQLRYRAQTIAETELARAYNRGNHEYIRQMMESGQMPVMREIWSTAANGHVCSACEDLEGTEVAFDAQFSVEIGKNVKRTLSTDIPPLHPRCRCALQYVETGEYIQNSEALTGLAAGDEWGGIPEHDEPEIIGSIDATDKDAVKLLLMKYEKDIVGSSIENAIVVCSDGTVYRCRGTLNGVYPDYDLGERLIGAYVTHNHPIGSDNEYSFSERDVALFMKYQLVGLRGIDELFSYELTRNPSDIDVHKSVFELDEFSGRHESMIEIARTNGLGYRRWKRG